MLLWLAFLRRRHREDQEVRGEPRSCLRAERNASHSIDGMPDQPGMRQRNRVRRNTFSYEDASWPAASGFSGYSIKPARIGQ